MGVHLPHISRISQEELNIHLINDHNIFISIVKCVANSTVVYKGKFLLTSSQTKWCSHHMGVTKESAVLSSQREMLDFLNLFIFENQT